MEEDEIQAQVSKFPRVGNIGSKIASTGINDNNDEQYPDEEEDGELELMKRRGGGGGSDGSTNRFHHHNSTSSWNNHSSRIIRVSRASGGKDRHSKVMTSKGLRDRRVRLSVATAIQFYDLQDRLGYDQPSKAVEWLIKAASDAISELPSFNNTFPETPRQPSDERRPGAVGAEREQHGLFDEVDGDTNNYPQQNQSHNLSLSKSACSSTSETSKGSGLSLSRSEMRVNRVKARERARERAAKEKENESRININSNANYHHHHNVNNNNNNNPMSQNASFTELLTGGIGNNGTITVPNTTNSPTGSVHQIHHGGDEVNLFNKETITTTTRQQQQQQQQHWSSTVTPIMDYFSPGLLVGPPSSSRTNHHQSSSSGFSGQIQLGTSLPVTPFSGENHSDQMQQFSFMNDHLIMPAAAVVTSSSTSSHHQHHSGGDYGLNFSISSSSGLAGYNNNRGTLQSNSHHNHPFLLPHHHHLQRFISPMDGSSSNVPFSIGGVSQASATPPTMDNNNNHHQFFSVFDGRLQLYYGDGSRHSADQKGKGKN